MTGSKLGITVLIPTYNRAVVLRRTLEDLTRVDRADIPVEVVVIDNNSTDNTAVVAQEFLAKLPLKLLQEKRPGKNSALNRALAECTLREIVVFADDDVTPEPHWLQEIMASVVKWPEVSVFGGRVEILWPENRQPEWAKAEWIRTFGYSWHHYAETDAFYHPPACPFGPNYWVRRSVFEKVPRFDESIGPRPKDRIMGSETSFLLALHRAGLRMLYYPGAVVQHRILEKECRIAALRRRGFTFGRGQVRLHGLHRQKLLARNRILWTVTLVADYLYTAARFAVGYLSPNSRRNCELTVSSMIRFGSLRETRLRIDEGYYTR